jgi:hypothetical protein
VDENPPLYPGLPGSFSRSALEPTLLQPWRCLLPRAGDHHVLHVDTGLRCIDSLEPLQFAIERSKDDRPVADLLTAHKADLSLFA